MESNNNVYPNFNIIVLEGFKPQLFVDRQVHFRARVHRIRIQSKIIFIVARQNSNTIQCIYFKTPNDEETSKNISELTKESIVDITGTIKAVKPAVKSCTIKNFEINILSIKCVSSANSILPIQIDERIYLPDKSTGDELERESKLVTRLNNRVLDLRKSENQLIFRLQAAISKIIRKFFNRNNFMEIHSPKLIGTASEGGSNVFEVKYFDQCAYLAQSPQLYKQMAICADFQRVYEIGPIFRAEKSYTHRHLTEFTGIDMEMTINQNYHEILDIFNFLFIELFEELKSNFGTEIEEFWSEYGIEPFEFSKPSVRITFKEGVKLLRESGIETGDFDDFNTEKERALGKIIKQKYKTDFFMVDQFPTNIRPFYTQINNDDPNYSNSYDFFIRGEEILSGSQRISDYHLLLSSAKNHNIDIEKISDYLQSFKYGVSPHGGGGIGLERVTMLYLGINNIRNVSLFPRDPTRIIP